MFAAPAGLFHSWRRENALRRPTQKGGDLAGRPNCVPVARLMDRLAIEFVAAAAIFGQCWSCISIAIWHILCPEYLPEPDRRHWELESGRSGQCLTGRRVAVWEPLLSGLSLPIVCPHANG